MAAKIGILGESVVVVQGTVTIYTCPADKAARIRIMFAVEVGSVACQYNIMIGAPGSEIALHIQPGAGNSGFSGAKPEATPDPTLSVMAGVSGVQFDGDGTFNLTSLSTNLPQWFRVPLPSDYFLSTGDTVKFNLSSADIDDHLIQVMGVEDDA